MFLVARGFNRRVRREDGDSARSIPCRSPFGAKPRHKARTNAGMNSGGSSCTRLRSIDESVSVLALGRATDVTTSGRIPHAYRRLQRGSGEDTFMAANSKSAENPPAFASTGSKTAFRRTDVFTSSPAAGRTGRVASCEMLTSLP